jgi:hypothetical protein
MKQMTREELFKIAIQYSEAKKRGENPECADLSVADLSGARIFYDWKLTNE